MEGHEQDDVQVLVRDLVPVQPQLSVCRWIDPGSHAPSPVQALHVPNRGH